MTSRRLLLSLIAVLALVAAACGDDNAAPTTTAAPATTEAMTDDSMSDDMGDDSMSDDMSDDMSGDEMSDDMMCSEPSLHLDVSGLPELGDAALYEGWAIIDGTPVSTGTLNVVDGVAVHGPDATAVECFYAERLENAEAIVITIEPYEDPDPAPSDTHIVAGDVTDGSAMLTVSHPAAIGTDFSDAAGTFLLATPTDGTGNNELSGIWFLELPGPTPSLVLPELPAGWKYEGWAVIDGVPVTSGTFVSSEGADDFDGFSGDQGGPPFPGEDYLVNAPDGLTFPTDLTGATVVISVEPDPDDSPAPFAIKPLIGTAGDPATDHESYPLENTATDLPFAVATIG